MKVKFKLKKHRYFLLAVFFLIFLISILITFNQKQKQIQKNVGITVKVERVIDGDTIVLEGGQIVRYIGVNTPETKHPKKSIECFGKEAAEKNTELVLNKRVRLEKDVSETDKYKRLLRYVYVGDIFVNDYLVKEGFAYVSSFPPDIKYQDQFLLSQKEAQENKRGLWGREEGCGV